MNVPVPALPLFIVKLQAFMDFTNQSLLRRTDHPARIRIENKTPASR